MEWLLEVVLVVLLGATLFHALRLERALGVLKRDRSVLEELVAGFNSSTRQAEDGIDRLRAAADGAGRQIARQIDTVGGLKDDLVFLTERGEALADRLETLVRTGRHIAPAPTQSAAGHHGRYDDPGEAGYGLRVSRSIPADVDSVSAEGSTASLPGPSDGQGPVATEPARTSPRPRSQAERDLLKALRVGR